MEVYDMWSIISRKIPDHTLKILNFQFRLKFVRKELLDHPCNLTDLVERAVDSIECELYE